jgi:hypothetical protein
VKPTNSLRRSYSFKVIIVWLALDFFTGNYPFNRLSRYFPQGLLNKDIVVSNDYSKPSFFSQQLSGPNGSPARVRPKWTLRGSFAVLPTGCSPSADEKKD